MEKSNLHLKKEPVLNDYQDYIKQLVQERGYKSDTLISFRHLVEEVGELSRSIRKMDKEPSKTHKHELGLELADVFIFILDICNHYDIDLETYFREKEEVNKKRIQTK